MFSGRVLHGLSSEIQIAREGYSDEEFNEFQKKAFGDRVEAANANTRKLLNSMMPPEYSEELNKLPSKALGIMSLVLDKVYQKHYSEGGIPGNNSGSDQVDNQEVINKLWGSEEYKNVMHPQHKAVKARINKFYGLPPEYG